MSICRSGRVVRDVDKHEDHQMDSVCRKWMVGGDINNIATATIIYYRSVLWPIGRRGGS